MYANTEPGLSKQFTNNCVATSTRVPQTHQVSWITNKIPEQLSQKGNKQLIEWHNYPVNKARTQQTLHNITINSMVGENSACSACYAIAVRRKQSCFTLHSRSPIAWPARLAGTITQREPTTNAHRLLLFLPLSNGTPTHRKHHISNIWNSYRLYKHKQ